MVEKFGVGALLFVHDVGKREELLGRVEEGLVHADEPCGLVGIDRLDLEGNEGVFDDFGL